MVPVLSSLLYAEQIKFAGSPETWTSRKDASWHTEAGVVHGTLAGSETASWLTEDDAHQDFSIRLRYRVSHGSAGIMFWSTRTAQGTNGLYISLMGDDTGTLFRKSIDDSGKETAREKISRIYDEASDGPVKLPLSSTGWNEVEVFVRGGSVVESFNGFRTRPIVLSPELIKKTGSYSPIAIGITGAGADVRMKDLNVQSLLQRTSVAEITAQPFKKLELTDLFYSESVAVGDINKDGNDDIVSGPWYFLGPDFRTAREIYKSATYNPNTPPYTDSFLNYVYDFNGDGWPDVLKINFEGAYLYINPKGQDRHWSVSRVVQNIAIETTQMVDIDGDGKPELLMAQLRNNKYEQQTMSYAKPNWSDATKPWTIVPVAGVGDWGAHGMGAGDINGDGRMDIVHSDGWWEQLAPGKLSQWQFHAAPFSDGPWKEMQGAWAGGADMMVFDVNGDGLPDVVTSLAAHGWGLAWFEQIRDKRDQITWKRHMIMGNPSDPDRAQWEETDKSVAFSELHALALVDMDGDGLPDIVTGKRWWSHGDNYSGPGGQDTPVLYWFKLSRGPHGRVSWIPHMINNRVGIGTQMAVTDVNKDHSPDVVIAARRGVAVFLNHRASKDSTRTR